MKQLYILFVLLSFVACDKTKVGYLEVDKANYDPETMVVQKNPDAEEEADRIERKIPWVSSQIQGILGTFPIHYEIAGVHTSDGDIASFKKEVKLRGDSCFEVPFENSIKNGTYYIDVNIYNRGYSRVRDSLFVIIVE